MAIPLIVWLLLASPLVATTGGEMQDLADGLEQSDFPGAPLN